MFRRRDEAQPQTPATAPAERITSVLGDGVVVHGKITGRGGVRIEGAFEGEIALNGMLVVGTTGRVTCPHLQAQTVIVAGALRGDITAEKVEIRSTGRVWGNVVTVAFSTEEGAYLRGQIQMEDRVELDFPEPGDTSVEAVPPAP
ncbi:MAG: polymer-forming cytoskeletal protein [Anaerolineae bacterium]|nr:MAG: polymer-forming cytoskeletal protein [Anaerolineae bacterium]